MKHHYLYDIKKSVFQKYRNVYGHPYAKSVIICTLHPAEREETRNFQKFAMEAQKVKNNPKLNEMINGEAMIERVNQKFDWLYGNNLKKRNLKVFQVIKPLKSGLKSYEITF